MYILRAIKYELRPNATQRSLINRTCGRCRFVYNNALAFTRVSADGTHFETLAKMDFRYLSTEVIGGFTGVMLGVFAQSDVAKDKGYADIDWFEYKTK